MRPPQPSLNTPEVLSNHIAVSARGGQLCVAVLALTAVLLVVEANAQGTRYVSPSGDDTENTCLHAATPCRSIQKGLDAAVSGDTLLVSAGIFYESGVVLYRDVTLIGEGAENTIVDGDGKSGSRTLFLADARATLAAARKLDGIATAKNGPSEALLATVRNALASSYERSYAAASASPSTFILRVERGVTAQVQGVTIRDGGGFDSKNTKGGIINEGDLTLLDARVENNVAYHADNERPEGYGHGGGVWSGGTLTIHRSTIVGNIAVGAFLSGGRGGGIYSEGLLTMSGTTVAENETWDVQDYCRGGGLFNAGTATITTSEIVRNGGTCFEGGAGGGILNEGNLHIETSVVGGNRALSIWEYSAGSGGGIANYGELVLLNSTISRNKSGSGGGIFSSGNAQIESSTIVENDAEDRPYAAGEGGGVRSIGSTLTLWNTIVIGNRAGERMSSPVADCAVNPNAKVGYLLAGAQTGCPGASRAIDPEAALLDVFGIEDEARREAYTYIPLAHGPAIDSGQCYGRSGISLTSDQRGNERPIDDPSVPDVSDGCDVGAIELQRNVDEVSSGTNVATEGGEMPRESQLQQNYPNPFDTSTQIEFILPQSTHAMLVVFDLSGREVAHLVDGTLSRGRHQIAWNASGLPSGVYMYRLTAGSSNTVRRMVLLKGTI